MTPEVILINRPAIDFQSLLGITLKVLGYSLSRASDNVQREMSDAERFLSCLAAMRETPTLAPKLLSHTLFSALVVAAERDMTDILECCSGMAFVIADTLARGIQCSIISGTLAKWRDAVASGCEADVEPQVRFAFNKLLGLFTDEHLNLWTDYCMKQAPDNITFLLEDKRK